jgi:hypothetical protein
MSSPGEDVLEKKKSGDQNLADFPFTKKMKTRD